jgi:DNA-binding CsgD family transcriptional regulator
MIRSRPSLVVVAWVRPVLLVVDDVHWLDRVSAEVLGAVGRRLTDPRVAIVAGRRAPYESAFSAAGWAEVPLAALGAEDAVRLLKRAGAPLTEATTAALLTAAAGNPLALTELPRFAGRIDYGPASIPLTDRLVAVFGGRLEQLEADVRAELLRAALDGTPVAAPSLHRPRYVMHNVEAAIKAGTVVADPLGQFVFRHPLVRAAVVHQASPSERRDAHRDLAALYQDVLMHRAYHLAAAADAPDQEVADLLARAAQLSGRRGGLAVAVEWLRRAAELSTDSARRSAYLADAIFIAARAGRLDETQDLLDSTHGGFGESAAAVLADCYRAFHADGDVASTHRRLLSTLAGADSLNDGMVNQLVNLLLSVTGFSGDLRYRDQANVALPAVEKRVNPAILLYRAGVEDIVGTACAARRVLEGSVEFLPQLPARWVMLLSFPAYCIDAMADFRAPLARAFAEVSSRGASIDAIEGGRVVLIDLVAAGQWDRAEEVGATCLEMARQNRGSVLVRHQLLADLGVLAANRGDVETARRYADEVTAWAGPRGLDLHLALTRRIAVRVALAEVDYEAAYQAATLVNPAGHFPSHIIAVAEDMLDLVEAALLSGHREQARAHALEAVRLNLAEVSPRVAALTLAISAMTAPDAEAGELYQAAVTHPGLAEFPFDHARIALTQGMWLRRSRRHTEARNPLELAAEIFERLGARPWANRARAELRAAKVSTSQASTDTPSLTAQERRIAELAADGHTSKKIAAKLSLSSRTVDVHLGRTFRKLGITSRAGLSEALRNSAPAAEDSSTV